MTLDDFKYQKNLDLDAIWGPLLDNTHDLSPYNFPPEILASLGKTLEIQAALMLIHHCVNNKVKLHIQGDRLEPTGQVHLLKIIDHNVNTAESAIENTPAQLLSLLTLRTEHDQEELEPNFNTIDEVHNLSKINRCLLAYWVDDQDYFNKAQTSEDKEQCNLLYVLWEYSKKQDRTFSQQITTPLARYYIYTGTYASDEVVIDKLFLRSYESTPNEHWAEMINLYAHIKCGLPYSSEKLKMVIKQCRQHNLV